MSDRVDAVVVGAGVVGLAVARALAEAGREVLIIEGESGFGQGNSSRNSEVIHAGMYYPTGSAKARFCVMGRPMLYEYCAARGIDHARIGKLIIASDEGQRAKLESILAQGRENGVENLALIDGAAVHRLEPALDAVAALHSPDTGIVDSHALMTALLADAEAAGAVLVRRTRVTGGAAAADGVTLAMDDGTRITAALAVNAAGLGAPALAAAIDGLAPEHVPQAHVAKGSYFTLSRRVPFTRLIYPIPEPGGLGIHLTLDLAGGARFGPDVEWLADPARLDHRVDPARGPAFAAAIRRWWPDLPADALQPGYSGMRPKLFAAGRETDFRIEGGETHGIPGLINLFGIESPGLTSSLAIAGHVARLAAASRG